LWRSEKKAGLRKGRLADYKSIMYGNHYIVSRDNSSSVNCAQFLCSSLKTQPEALIL